MAWEFGGRSLVDEVNHVNMVVFLCYYVLHVYFLFMMMMMMWYNGLLVEDVNNRILQTSNLQTHSLMY